MKISGKTARQEKDGKRSQCDREEIFLFCSLDKVLEDFEKSADQYVEPVKQLCDLVCEMETTVRLMDKPEDFMETPIK